MSTSFAPYSLLLPPIQRESQRRTRLESCPLKQHSKLPSLQSFRSTEAPTRRIVAFREFLGNPPPLNHPPVMTRWYQETMTLSKVSTKDIAAERTLAPQVLDHAHIILHPSSVRIRSTTRCQCQDSVPILSISHFQVDHQFRFHPHVAQSSRGISIDDVISCCTGRPFPFHCLFGFQPSASYHK